MRIKRSHGLPGQKSIVKTTLFTGLLLLLMSLSPTQAQNIPSPKEHFGFSIGDNYQLATFTQTEAYFKKLAAASDRARLVGIGKTEEGRDQFMMIVTSPENQKKLDHYKEISQRLAHAEGLTDEQAHLLAAEGKTVVWIDGGLHATEVVATHQLIEIAYQLLSRKDPETLRILDNVIILLTQVNPDGQELVSNWYMREPKPEKRSLEGVPVLYEKYAGHDNNRDFFMFNLKETQNIGRQLFVEWIPQIMYNHHQAGPAGSILAGPPYRDPFNYVFDPLLITSIDAVGAAMNNRLNVEGKPGYTQRSGSSFSTWYNGGLRTTTYFHNMIGLLTEIVGGPNPSEVPLIPQRLIPNGATPNPVIPQKWYFRQSIDYSVSLNYAVLDYAVRYRDELLYNIYRMGRNSIDRGSRDNWTLSPKRIATMNQLYADAPKASGTRVDKRAGSRTDSVSRSKGVAEAGADSTGRRSKSVTEMGSDSTGRRSKSVTETGSDSTGIDSSMTASGERPDPNAIPTKYFDSVMRNPALRDPRAYIIPSGQADFPTAVRFVNALIRAGILVHRASAAFIVAGKTYHPGSYIIRTDQAFRPHVLDMFEPQDHPNDFLYPGGPPVAPYDAAGWTLAFQMGVQFDRILEGVEGPFERIPYGELQAVPGWFDKQEGKGYVLDAHSNQSYAAANDLLKEGIEVFRIPSMPGKFYDSMIAQAAAGSFYIPISAKARKILEKQTTDRGVTVHTLSKRPAELRKISPARIALWDNYGGSISSGWERWIMEQYHFPVTILYPKDIDAGNLRSKYDVLIFVTGAIPAVTVEAGGRGFGRRGEPKPEEIPAEYRPRLGRITQDKSIPELKKFLEAGGHIVTIGSSCNLAFQLELPVRNALVELNNGKERKLPGEKFYIPGSLLRVSVDSSSQPGWGMDGQADVYFDESPVFTITPEAYSKGQIKPIAWFANNKPLRSGWAWGQAYLQDGVAAFIASVGKGKLIAFGPEITFRAQTHGTFKFLFNQLYLTPDK